MQIHRINIGKSLYIRLYTDGNAAATFAFQNKFSARKKATNEQTMPLPSMRKILIQKRKKDYSTDRSNENGTLT